MLGSLGAKGAFRAEAIIVTSGSFKVELELEMVVVVVKKGLAVVVTAEVVEAVVTDSASVVVIDVVVIASSSASFALVLLPVAGYFLLRSKVEETNACQTGPRTFGVLSLLS